MCRESSEPTRTTKSRRASRSSIAVIHIVAGRCAVAFAPAGDAESDDSDAPAPDLTTTRAGSEPGSFDEPAGLGSRDGEHVYVADKKNRRLQKLRLPGYDIVGACADLDALGVQPLGVALVGGMVFCTDNGNHRLVGWRAATLEFCVAAGKWGDAPGKYKDPCGLAACGDDVLYVADTGNHRIQAVSLVGEPLRTFGRFGDEAGKFQSPYGIASRAARCSSPSSSASGFSSSRATARRSPPSRRRTAMGRPARRAHQGRRAVRVCAVGPSVYVCDFGKDRLLSLTWRAAVPPAAPRPSVEVFVPRSAAGESAMLERLAEIVAVGPPYVAVSAAADDDALRVACRVQRAHGVRGMVVLPRPKTPEAAVAAADAAVAAGVRDVLLIDGDGDADAMEVEGGGAAALVRLIKERHPSLRVAVAGHPRGCCAGDAYAARLAALAEQVAAGASASSRYRPSSPPPSSPSSPTRAPPACAARSSPGCCRCARGARAAPLTRAPSRADAREARGKVRATATGPRGGARRANARSSRARGPPRGGRPTTTTRRGAGTPPSGTRRGRAGRSDRPRTSRRAPVAASSPSSRAAHSARTSSRARARDLRVARGHRRGEAGEPGDRPPTTRRATRAEERGWEWRGEEEGTKGSSVSAPRPSAART